jgi:RHS repeat-associated protein
VRRRAGRRVAAVAAAALAFQLLVAPPAAALTLSTPALFLSGSPQRQTGFQLSGATMTYPAAVYLENTTQSLLYQSVAFYLDDPGRTRAPLYVDTAIRWDMLGSPECADGIPCPHGTARLFDPLTITEGRHSVTAVITVPPAFDPIPPVTAYFTVRYPPSVPPIAYPEPVPGGVPTTMVEAARFLYAGDLPTQYGVASGTIKDSLAAVVRGRVTKPDGTAFANANVVIAGHPEYGTTRTRADGWYDMAVNAGAPLTVTVSSTGYLTSERTLDPDPHAWVIADATALVPVAPSTSVTPSTVPAGDFAVARGPVVTDTDGTRRSTLLVPSGTTADLVLQNGSHQAASGTWAVRQTELTVGDDGERRMPAPLPPTSAYTYAVDLSIDQATTANAKRTEFSQPLWHYNENFLGFPAGTAVPAGYYDQDKHAWVPSQNGIVLDVVSETGGRADVDITGDGVADGATPLAAIGMTDDERAKLAALYDPGASLWRVGITHFSFWDFNWGFGLALDAIFPLLRGLGGLLKALLPNCFAVGSVIGCESQSLGERVGLTGTGTDLVYDSRRVPGNRSSSALSLLVTPHEIPDSLNRVEVVLDVAGRRFTQSIAAAPDARYTFDWDGIDAFGRLLNGAQIATLRVRYVYDGVYGDTPRFSAPAGQRLAGNPTRREVYLDRTFTTPLQPSVVADARGLGLGGWMLAGHHTYDGETRTLAMGDGRVVQVDSFGGGITTLAGTGAPGFSGDNGPATDATLRYPGAATYDAAGNLYIADTFNDRIRKVTTAGVISTVATDLHSPLEMSFGADGTLYVADVDNHRVARVAANGAVTSVAGDGTRAFGGDGGLATAARLKEPTGVAAAADGRLFVADYADHRIRVVSPDGVISTLAGDGTAGFAGDGGPATAARLSKPSSVAVDSAGVVYVADSGNGRVRRIAPDGTIATVASGLSMPVGVALGPDGDLYVAERDAHRVRRVGPDGSVTTVAGTGIAGTAAEQATASTARLNRPRALTMAPDGALVVVDAANQRIRRIGAARPLGTVTSRLVPSPDDDGTVFEFSATGRHVRTLDERTGVALLTFAYDAAGRLDHVTDRDGNALVVTRPTASTVVVTSPDGQATTLTLNSDGWATSIAAPGGLTNTATYTATGLLRTFVDRNGHGSLYGYDAIGRLESARGRDLRTTTLTRTELDNGLEVEVSTPGGHDTVYRLVRDASGAVVRDVVDPFGITRHQEVRPDGTSVLDVGGTVLTATTGPDPRWGRLRPIPVSTTVQAPGRSPVTSTFSRSVSLASADVLDVASMVDTHTVGARTWRTTYAKSSRSVTTQSPEGRTAVTTLDALGHVVASQAGNLAPVTYGYDSRGRLTSTSKGSGAAARQSTVTYKPNGFVDTVTNALDQATSYSYDTALRPSSSTGPRGTLLTAYDGNGNVTSVTPPARPAYTLTPSVDDRLASYRLPDVDAAADEVTYALDDDRRFVGATLPSGTVVSFGFDAAGRLETLTHGSAATTFTWSSGRLASATSPDSVAVTPGYTSGLPTSETWSGPFPASVSWTYDDELRVTSQTAGGTAVSFGRDDDGLLTSAGAETLTRDPATGFVTATSLGSTTTSQSYSTFGEPTAYTAKYGTTTLYGVTYPARDDAGRIVERVETTDGATHSTSFGYDATNRLDTVTVDGSVTASYDYDGAGNLVTENAGGVTTTSTYDAQDRITSRGPVTYTYSADGERLSGTSGTAVTTYGWSSGRLASVSLPGGPVVSYQYDAFGRRIARLLDGVVVRGYLWDGDRVVAETDASGTVLSRFVYGSRGHVPDYLVNGGVTYRLVHDERGSIRLVVSTATGTVVQRLAYDPWGRVTSDTNPAFQPFGYAGGLTDPTTGLIRFGARDYDPTTTQWLSRDPIGFTGGPNHYAYADGDPVNRIDPTGHNALGCFADIMGLAGMIPVVGTVFDIASALAYATNGDWGSAGLALAGVILPLGASQLKGIARYGDEALEYGDEAAGFVGRKGVVKHFGDGSSARYGGEMGVPRGTNSPGKVGGTSYSGHAFDQMQGRGFTPTVVDDVIKNGEHLPSADGTIIHYSPENDTSVVTGRNNFVVTVVYGSLKPR